MGCGVELEHPSIIRKQELPGNTLVTLRKSFQPDENGVEAYCTETRQPGNKSRNLVGSPTVKMMKPTTPDRCPHQRWFHLLATAPLLGLIACTIQVDAEDYIRACAVGATRCSEDGRAIERCLKSSSGFEILEECKEEDMCQNGSCVPINPHENVVITSPDATETPEIRQQQAQDILSTSERDVLAQKPMQARLRFQVIRTRPGGTVDFGFCAGSSAHSAQRHARAASPSPWSVSTSRRFSSGSMLVTRIC